MHKTRYFKFWTDQKVASFDRYDCCSRRRYVRSEEFSERSPEIVLTEFGLDMTVANDEESSLRRLSGMLKVRMT